MITAKLIRNLDHKEASMVTTVALQAVYELSEPVTYEAYEKGEGKYVTKTTRFVLVSAATVMMSGPETFIFPADEDGEVVDWAELEGSYKGGLSHAEAIDGAGWELVS